MIYKFQGNSFRDVPGLDHVSKSQAHYLQQKFQNHGTINNLWVSRTSTRLIINQIRDIVGGVEANCKLTAMDVTNDPALIQIICPIRLLVGR